MENKEPEPLGLGTPVYAPELKMYSCKYTENETIIDLVEWKNDRLEFNVSDENTSAALGMLNEKLHELAAENAGLKSELETLRAERKELMEQEPVEWQFQSRDGLWNNFSSEKHRIDTIDSMAWPIRKLYAKPMPVQPFPAVPEGWTITPPAADGSVRVMHESGFGTILRPSIKSALWAADPEIIIPGYSEDESRKKATESLLQPSPAVAVHDVANEEMLSAGVEAMERGLLVFGDNHTQVVSNIWEDMYAEAMLSTPTPPSAAPVQVTANICGSLQKAYVFEKVLSEDEIDVVLAGSPSAEQKCTCHDAYDAWQYAEGARCNYCAANGDKPSGMYTQSVEQPDSATHGDDIKIEAGYAHVESVVGRADGNSYGAPWWYGWAVREAFVAGAEWHEKYADIAIAAQAIAQCEGKGDYDQAYPSTAR